MRLANLFISGLILLSITLGVAACRGGSESETEPVSQASQTETEPLVDVTPEIQITLGEMETELRQIEVESIAQKNCGGTEAIENEIERRRIINHLIEVGAGYEVNANGEVGIPGGIASVGLGAAVTGEFGYSYGFSEEIARSIRVRASPGTNMNHQISHQEIWKVGQALILINGQEYTIPYSYRSDFSVELIDSQDLGDCPVTETSASNLSADESIAPTNTPVAPNTTPPPPEPTATPIPQRTAATETLEQNEIIVLAENSGNTYNWENGAPNVTTQLAFEGQEAFIPTGNNSFRKELATVGYEPDEVRYINLRLYLLREDAGFLLQVLVDRDWNHRWGFDGRASYQGQYTYRRQGQTLNIPVGEWVEIQLDLINDLGARPGQIINGMALSAADGNMLYDYITFTSSLSLTSCLPPSLTQAGNEGYTIPQFVVLSNTADNTFTWENGSPYTISQVLYEGDAAFIPNGNNSFRKELATVGYEPDEARFITMKVCLLKPEAGLLLQVLVDRDWDHGWGIDGRASYQGSYSSRRRGQSLNVPVGEWKEIQLDLIEDLGARPGQIINGMALSAADGYMIYDQVGFTSSFPLSVCLPPENVQPRDGATIPILSNEEDNIYDWENGSPYITTQALYEGNAAFIPNGNNSFRQDLATIGNEASEARYLTMKICLLKKEAGLLLQVRIDNNWDHRWGFDGRSNYQGVYNNGRRGQNPNLPVGEWIDVKIDLIDDLGARPGQLINGLAFSAADGYMIYDQVSFASSQ